MGPLWTGALEAASAHGVDLCVQDTGPLVSAYQRHDLAGF